MQEVMNYKDTRIENFHTIYPNHMNRHDTLFGGQTLYWLDDVQGLVIRRYTHLPFFTRRELPETIAKLVRLHGGNRG